MLQALEKAKGEHPYLVGDVLVQNMTNDLNQGHYDVAGGRQEFLAKLYDLVTGE